MGQSPPQSPQVFRRCLVKTCRNLYPQVYAWENADKKHPLELAYRRARKGKRAQVGRRCS